MNPHYWIRRFRENETPWVLPETADSSLQNDPRRPALARAFATFQLGETGGGTRLMRFARKSFPGDEARIRAVGMFLAEEHRHSEMLAGLVGYLGGRLRRHHWQNAVFRRLRTLLGLEFNLQILLTAELVAVAWYGLLASHVPDPIVRSACARITRDEVLHVAFQAAVARSLHRRRLPVSSHLWALQFQGILLVVELAAWWEFRRCLQSFGITRHLFQRRVHSAARGFLRQALGESGVIAPGRRDPVVSQVP